MPAKAKEDNSAVHSLEDAKVLLLDPDTSGVGPIKDRLIDVGIRKITNCASLRQMTDELKESAPDLLMLDLDGGREAVCELIQKLRTGKLESKNPFVVVIALTAKPDKDIVQAALAAGADDMIVKPVTSKTVRERVTRQIEERKQFIATADYVGPDRRPEGREPSDENLCAIDVPNSLRHVVTGDETAALSDDRIQETLRSLSAQKFYHLSLKIGTLAGEAQKALSKKSDFPLLGDCVGVISTCLGEIEEIMADQDFQSVREVVASTREALAGVESAEPKSLPRCFELLKIHGQSIGAVLKESDEASGVLITELERAVQVVVKDKAQKQPEAQAAPEPVPGAAPAAQTELETPQETKFPMKVRFLAWWEGVDPDEIAASQQSE